MIALALTRPLSRRRAITALAVAALARVCGGALPASAAEPVADASPVAPPETTWAGIRGDIFGERVIGEAGDVVAMEAPARAEDAAMVPLTLRLAAPEGTTLKALTLVIDENPSPVAGTFTFGPGRTAFLLSTRVRVNSYSFVRAVAETGDGRLFMAKAFVKASGGCSAPATKDPAEAASHAGEIRFRSFAGTGQREAQVQIRHPNYSGLQMDQVTRLYTPAWFVRAARVSQNGQPIFAMEGGISISEDPTFRFSFEAAGTPVEVEAQDTEGKTFTATFP